MTVNSTSPKTFYSTHSARIIQHSLQQAQKTILKYFVKCIYTKTFVDMNK